MDEKKPSEVFLALWYSRICGQVIAREDFFALAETWAEIRRMETAQTTYKVFTPYPVDPEAVRAALRSSFDAAPVPSQGTESTPESVEKVHPDRVEKVHGDEPEPVVQNEPSSGPDPAKSAAAAAGMANRKRNDMARLEAIRARGVSMQTVAESAAGLTLNDVLDFLDRKPIQLPKLVALEKAMKKLETGMPSQSGEAGQLPQRGSQSNGEAST